MGMEHGTWKTPSTQKAQTVAVLKHYKRLGIC
jgi:hypothetical protein